MSRAVDGVVGCHCIPFMTIGDVRPKMLESVGVRLEEASADTFGASEGVVNAVARGGRDWSSVFFPRRGSPLEGAGSVWGVCACVNDVRVEEGLPHPGVNY